MKIVEFFRGDIGNCNGHRIDEIMLWSNDAWEVDHDYIQWVFPSDEPSMMNCDAPVITPDEVKLFHDDPILCGTAGVCFHRFLRFLGMKLTIEADEPIVVSENDEVPQWLRSFNHNFLRVTRALKSLKLTNNERLAKALFKGLERYRNLVSDNCWGYWTRAATGSEPEEELPLWTL